MNINKHTTTMTREELEKVDLIEKYIDFQALCEEYDLSHGDISPEQVITLEKILIDFILQNKY